MNKQVEQGFFSNPKNSIIAILSSVIVGALVSIILIDYKIGVNYFFFATVCFGLIAYLMARDNNLDYKQLVFWSVAFLMYASTLFRLQRSAGLLILILPSIIVLFTIFAAKEKTALIIPKFFYRFFAFPVFFYRIFSVSVRKQKEGKSGAFGKIALGVGISVVLLIVIIPLMMGADNLFEHLVNRALTWENINEVIGRIIVSTIVTLAGFGFIYLITANKRHPEPKGEPGIDKQGKSTITVITVLSAIALVFLIFCIVQFNNLFAGLGGLPDGYHYADNAVNGYWEQFGLTLINAGIILVSLFLTNHAQPSLKKAVNILLLGLIAMNVYLVVSAGYKMNLYQQAYGFTYLRSLVYLILLFELIMFGLIVYKVFKREFPLIKAGLYIGVAYFAIVAMFNLEAFSVKQNMKRFEATGEIDIDYIVYECPDASKQLNHLFFEYSDMLTDDQEAWIVLGISSKFGYEPFLAMRTDELDAVYRENKNMIDFNISRYREYKYAREIISFAEGPSDS